MEEKQIKIEYAPIYYCMATASARTSRIEGGDIILSINGNTLYTTPTTESSFANADTFFTEFVVPKIDEATKPRTLRVIRFFRKVGGPTNKGRYVAPRDAKLNHGDATYIFDKNNLNPIATFKVGDTETDNEDIRISNAREAGATSVVFDVIFPDSESMGINLWSNVLMWQSSLGATDNRPVIQTGTKRVLPSAMAGAAPAPPPFMRAAMSGGNSSGIKESPARRITESPAITPQKATQQSSTGSAIKTLSNHIDNSTMFTEFVDPLVARHSTSGKTKEEPKRLPKPSETAGSAPAPPPFIRRAGFPAGVGNPSEGTSTLRRLQYGGKSSELISTTEPTPSLQLQTPSGGLSDFDDSDDVVFATAPVVVTPTPSVTITPTPNATISNSPQSNLISPPNPTPVSIAMSESSAVDSRSSQKQSTAAAFPVASNGSSQKQSTPAIFSAPSTGSGQKQSTSAVIPSSPSNSMREARKLFSDGSSPTSRTPNTIPIKNNTESKDSQFHWLWLMLIPMILVVIAVIMKDDANFQALIASTTKTCKELMYGKPPPPPPPLSPLDKVLSYFGIK